MLVTFLFSRTVKRIFSWNSGLFLRIKNHIRKHGINTRGSWRYTVLRSYEVNYLAWARNWTLFTTLQTFRSDVRFMKESFLWTYSFFTKLDLTAWNGSSSTDLQVTPSKLTFGCVWLSLQLEMSQNSGVSESMMNEVFPATVSELRKQIDSNWRPMSRLRKLREINIFIVSRGLCKMVSWWRLVYSL